MNKHVVLFLAVILATGSFVQKTSAQVEEFHFYTPNFHYTIPWVWPGDGSRSIQSTDQLNTTPQGTIWGPAGVSFAEYRTQSDGIGGFIRGNKEQSLTLYIDHQVAGEYLDVINNKGTDYSGNSTHFIGHDDPDKSRWNGKLSISHTAWNPLKLGSYTFTEGNYVGGNGESALAVRLANNFTINGASFVSGDNPSQSSGLSGATFAKMLGSSLTINNQTGKASDRFEAGHFRSEESWTVGGDSDNDLGKGDLWGGWGLAFVSTDPEDDNPLNTGTVTINGGDFIGSKNLMSSGTRTLNYTLDETRNAHAHMSGGGGVLLNYIETAKIYGGNYYGGDSGDVVAGGPNARVEAAGGDGLLIHTASSTHITNSYFKAGFSGSASIVQGSYYDAEADQTFTSDENGIAIASGGNGIHLVNAVSAGSATIEDVTAIGSRAGVAIATANTGSATAIGGAGLLARDSNLAIKSGTFNGAAGGFARGNGASAATGGAGVWVVNSDVVIEDGTFSGAAGGSARGNGANNATGGAGVWAVDSDVTIEGGTFNGGAAGNENVQTSAYDKLGIWMHNGNLSFNGGTNEGNILFYNTGTKNLTISGGLTKGSLLFDGGGTSSLTISGATDSSGAVLLNGGILNITADQAANVFFRDVTIRGGTNTFLTPLTTAAGSSFKFEGLNPGLLEFYSLELTDSSRIEAGFNKVVTTDGDLEMGANSSIILSLNGLTGMQGQVDLGANSLVMSDPTARIYVNGAASTPEGSITAISGGTTTFATNNTVMVQANLGWLVKTADIDGNSGIKIDHEYNSLLNSELNDGSIDPEILSALDESIQTAAPNTFYTINKQGEEAGTEMIRHTVTQVPDVADAAFQTQHQVANQISARATEYRSMNGFASSNPGFSKNKTPKGVAGPTEEKNNLQGWIRAYGAWGNKDQDGNYAEYDTGTFGSIIGIDKSFGNLLVGLAGGSSFSKLDADDSYTADIKTYQEEKVYSLTCRSLMHAVIPMKRMLQWTESLTPTSTRVSSVSEKRSNFRKCWPLRRRYPCWHHTMIKRHTNGTS